ncbi:MAG TPA: phage integrase N-terminal SAM-like domain-containing protein [Anaerolineales bacterium]|jgi:integrase|nr:phage integrase N-terminal SAM-like domain-containing protein [Anaerolineales bacterium]
MLLSDAIKYYKVCKLADGYSPETLEVYEWAHIHFIDFVGDMPVGDIELERLRTFMLYMREDYTPNRAGGSTAPLSSSSLENLWKALRSFFIWAEEELEIPRPDKRLAKPPNPPPEINPYTHEDIKALISACDFTNPSRGRRRTFSMRRPSGRRDRATIMMLLDTGLRAGELARLTVGDVQSEKVYISPWRSGSVLNFIIISLL